MYVRVKRKKQTIFLHVEPTDTVLEVKQKLQDLVEQVGAAKPIPASLLDLFGPCLKPKVGWLLALQPPERQQLHKGNSVLDDAKKLAELKVENDDILALCFLQDGTCTLGPNSQEAKLSSQL